MNKNILLFLTLLILTSYNTNYLKSHDETKLKSSKMVNFFFDDKDGDYRKVTTLSKKDILVNNGLISSGEYKFITNLSVKLSEKQEKITEGQFIIFHKNNKANDYIAVNKIKTQFIREKNGKLLVDSSYFYPNLKNIPEFPDKGVRMGEGWEGNAIVSEDLRKYGISKPVSIAVKTYYRYLKNETIMNKECGVISVIFVINQNHKIPIGKQFRRLWLTKNGSFITRWMGIYRGKYYYSFIDKDIIRFDSNYNHLLFYEKGNMQEVKGSDTSIVERIRKGK